MTSVSCSLQLFSTRRFRYEIFNESRFRLCKTDFNRVAVWVKRAAISASNALAVSSCRTAVNIAVAFIQILLPFILQSNNEAYVYSYYLFNGFLQTQYA